MLGGNKVERMKSHLSHLSHATYTQFPMWSSVWELGVIHVIGVIDHNIEVKQ